MQDCIAKPVMMPDLLAKTAAWGAHGRQARGCDGAPEAGRQPPC